MGYNLVRSFAFIHLYSQMYNNQPASPRGVVAQSQGHPPGGGGGWMPDPLVHPFSVIWTTYSMFSNYQLAKRNEFSAYYFGFMFVGL